MSHLYPPLVAVILAMLTTAPLLASTTAPRQHLNWDADWHFHLGDLPGAEAPAYVATGWEAVHLPHDWAILGPIDEDNPGGGKMGYYPGGIGWYRKSFTLPEGQPGQRVFVQFDGVYMNSEVWINGHLLGKRPNGYVSFQYELTPHLRAGENVMAVRVDNAVQPSSRWYSGCGIYRHVWLTLTSASHLVYNGLFVSTPEVSAERALVRVEAEVAAGPQAKTLQLRQEVLRDGRVLAASATERVATEGPTRQELTLPEPRLWSPDTPELYTLRTTLLEGEQVVDVVETPFGVRTLRFTTDRGFFCNDVNLKLKGVCLHHDAGGVVGAAVPLEVLERRLRLLKDMGCNALRTAHNPHAPEFYELCDRLGFFVMAEILDEWRMAKPSQEANGYNRYFAEWAERDVEDSIRRDRNHPSVVMWSLGNEVRERGTAQAVADAKVLVDLSHRLDPTRPTTCAINFITEANASGYADAFDITGYNDGGGSIFEYRYDRITYPDRLFIGTEHPHSPQTRGVYLTTNYRRESLDHYPGEPDYAPQEVFTEWANGHYRSSYDNCFIWTNIRDSWRQTAQLPYIMGEFRWAGIDYLGESDWPTRASQSGIIDLAGFPKDHYYLYQSLWAEKPMVHVLPHWTWPGKEGVTIPVIAYTNAEEVELFLNEKSLGRLPMTIDYQIRWDVPYTPGTLRAVAYSDGRAVAETVHHTAEAAAALRLQVDQQTVVAGSRAVMHLEVDVVDAAGHFVPKADNRVRFVLDGPVELLGVENGDPVDHDPHQVPERRAFMGKCLAVVRLTEGSGPIRIRVEAEGLEAASAEVAVR